MALIENQSGLYIDHYELTMAQGFFLSGKKDIQARFDYFFRKAPFRGSHVIFAGLQNLLDMLKTFSFDSTACKFLKSRGFHDSFLSYLENFSFNGSVCAAREGEIVFPLEPVLWVEGNIIECQLIESMLLNILNFESLIATKAGRIRHAAGESVFVDFGLRRGQGTGSIQAARAAVIGGAAGTSNMLSAYKYDLVTTGTMAHSWVQSFPDELTAFREFALNFPSRCILLVDTYDTLKTGVPNAIKVAREMEERGERLSGIRLDSGDLAYLSKDARRMLDNEGLDYVKIIASNQLDEYVIRSLREQNSPIDIYGVGTNLVTGRDDAALDGVYKLVHSDGKDRMKISDNIEKMILPGKKKVFRFTDEKGYFRADAICLESEKVPDTIYHPYRADNKTELPGCRHEELIVPVMKKGKQVNSFSDPYQIAEYVKNRLKQLPDEHKRFEYPHIYKTGISKGIGKLREKLVKDMGHGL